MTEDIKSEAIEQLELDIKFGFENEAQLYQSIRDMFYNVDDFDEDWLRQEIAVRYRHHQEASLAWSKPTDFDRLVISFDQLIREKIICLHKAGYTRQDAIEDCVEVVERLSEMGIKAMGYCYYHAQDLARIVEGDSRDLYLGFDSATQNADEALKVAERIVAVLRENSFEVDWMGSADSRIEVKNVNWRKIPDNQSWAADRVIGILEQDNSSKKPFWKFW